jgi:isomerase DpgB
MVVRNGILAATGNDLMIRVDGSRPLSADMIAALGVVCDAAEDSAGLATVRIVVSGVPTGSWARDLTVALVSKWERAVRRLERLGALTVGVAHGDCGGMALDALLATDYRIATRGVRLMVPVVDGAVWPGLTVYRLTQQAGVAAVRRAVLFGRPIETGAARRLHLIDDVAEDLDSALAVTPAPVDMVSGSELAIRRRLMLDATTTSFEDALGTHLAACDRVLRGLSMEMAS